MKDDLINAGAIYTDLPAVIDKHCDNSSLQGHGTLDERGY